MSIEIKVPTLPESVADATIVTWHKKPGDAIKRDENLVDIETDKVVLEVPATADGILAEIIQGDGATVHAHDVIGRIEVGAAATAAPAAEPTKAAASQKATDAQNHAPSVRRALAETNVDVGALSGTGKDGRLTKQDVLQAATQAPKSAAVAAPVGERVEQRVPMTRLRARIAERLLDAQHNAALLTTFNEVNLKAVMDLRAEFKDKFEKKFGARLGFMSFFTKAVIEALKRFPEVNASIDGNDIVYHGFYDIGIAVSTERGLVVPILRNADQMSMAEIEAGISTFGQKAKAGTLTLEEMTGGTFTITNGGVFGSLLSTPIINPPQSAILGMHKIQERPVVEDGQIVIRPMMYLALSYDHRLIDGKTSVSFLVTIKELLENPARLLLGV
ncbi:MAG: sucB [Gammaproteobacteria bacterium]|jgi:2-oxoglutarate dehydrogenase E2 component (dihydrolipoamide succinyltransferase)|nr:sucB [Gammaproteobacteria bacterium]